MKPLRIACWVVGLSQIVLGILYLFVPAGFIAWQGLSTPAPDLGYPFAMFAARLLVYGVGMFVVARDPVRHAYWLFAMVAIQAIDLGAGFTYVASGIVSLENAVVPMANATLFILALGGFGVHVLRGRGFRLRSA